MRATVCRLLFVVCLIHLFGTSRAQLPPISNSADIYMQLKKLNMLGSVLYIAAHPDDENNALLPYLAKEKQYRTGYLSLTRGDGGQNLIGSEQGIELGMIRTQELLAARRVDGAEQFFTRAYEFGFSKNSAEALHFWDRKKVLSDVVWVIRNFQPDVIITRFPGDARAGHGHHSASSIIANEAFAAAADPKQFPEQFAYGVKPWQAKRILWNTLSFGNTNTTSDDQLKIDIGGYNPLLGKSYGELGGEARSMHKSQGEGRPRRRGPSFEYFTATGGDLPKATLMDGITTDWSRLPGGGKVQSMLNDVIAHYDFAQPELSVPALVALYKTMSALPESYWRNRKLAETQSIIENCSGLFTEMVAPEQYFVTGDTARVSFSLNNRAGVDAMLRHVKLVTDIFFDLERDQKTGSPMDRALFFNPVVLDTAISVTLAKNQNAGFSFSFINRHLPTQPYWVEGAIQNGLFNVSDQYRIGDAENPAPYTAVYTVEIAGQSFDIHRDIRYKYVDAAKGEVYQPVTVVPPLTFVISPDVVLTNIEPATSPVLKFTYKSNFNGDNIPVTLRTGQSSANAIFTDSVFSFRRNEVKTVSVPVRKIFTPGQPSSIAASFLLKRNGHNEVYDLNQNTIAYDHIPTINYFSHNRITVIDDKIITKGHRVGYIAGAGDKVPDALVQMGYDVSFISEADITDAHLKQFDAIVTGIRAYNIFEYLTNRNEVLNRYVQNGGNLIIQYMKTNQVGNHRIKAGPYPFSISSGLRVTEEDAKVNFLLPLHPVLNYPNKISDKDFEGWVQERSTYEVDQADPHFEMPLGMNDTGEKQGTGSLAIAKYGKGNVAYVGLVLFRQLPAGIPGSYKILANLIALQKNN